MTQEHSSGDGGPTGPGCIGEISYTWPPRCCDCEYWQTYDAPAEGWRGLIGETTPRKVCTQGTPCFQSHAISFNGNPEDNRRFGACGFEGRQFKSRHQ